jgi:hypothetical protein
MLEYIIITRPAETEAENTIRLLDNQLLQAGIKKDIETLESYLIHMNWAETSIKKLLRLHLSEE